MQWRQSGLKSGWVVDKSCRKQIQFFQGNFRKTSIFSGNFTKNSIFQASIGHLLLATPGQIVLFLFKSQHFRTYFLYMLRYIILRPVHHPTTLLRPPCDHPTTPPAKIWGSRPPNLPRIDAYGWRNFEKKVGLHFERSTVRIVITNDRTIVLF